jgi:heme-degrading monooxygenase HmoA
MRTGSPNLFKSQVGCACIDACEKELVQVKSTNVDEHSKRQLPCAVVYDLAVLPENCDKLALSAYEGVQHLINQIAGFIEARLLVGSDHDRVTIYGAWKTRDDWSRAQWDKHFGVHLEAARLMPSNVSHRRRLPGYLCLSCGQPIFDREGNSLTCFSMRRKRCNQAIEKPATVRLL